MPPFRLVTNQRSRTYLALRGAGARLGVDVLAIQELGSTDALAAWEPDGALVFMYGWPTAAEEMVDLMRGLGIAVAVWQVDDPQYLHDPSLREVTIRIARRADVYFSHTRQLDAEYASLGIKVTYLPTGARLVAGEEPLVAGPLEDRACDRDVAFVGTLTASRRRLLRLLARRLPDRQVHVFEHVSPTEALEIYRSSRITLALGAAADTAGARCEGLTERSWEVPLVGGFLLQDEREHLAEHFGPDERATFTDARDCAERIVHYLDAPSERRAIAARAHERVLREHLIGHRLATIVAQLERVGRRDLPLAWRTAT